MKKIILLAIIAIVCFSCKEKPKQEKEVVLETPEKETTPIKLYILDGGTIVVNELSVFTQDDTFKGESKTFADPIYIIKHPKGILMWDAGLAETLVGQDPFTTPNGVFTVSRKDSLPQLLASIDLKVSDIDYLALSHTHFDHSGSAYLLKDATWLVTETELNFVNSDAVKEKAADNYKAIAMLTNIKKTSADYDVFNDGTVLIKAMPGHTPGHQVLWVNLPETGPVLLSGDLYHFQENRDNKGVPSFNTDVAQTIESMTAFEIFAKETKARVIIQHEAKDFAKMPKAPQFLN